jgi:purine-binding chemotaxis protein CheW
MGILQLGRHTIRVVDLQERLHSGNSGEKPRNSPFLVISRTPGGELCGIPVEEPPNLVELPLETIQTLPKADRYSKPALNLVSHVAVLSQEKVTTTIFLLDLQQVLNPTMPDAYPLALKSS